MKLVVDTSVARTAMPERVDLDKQKACVVALLAVQANTAIRVAQSDQLMAEWLKLRPNGQTHASQFALGWLGALRSAGRVVPVAGQRTDVNAAIGSVRLTGSVQALRNDAHVIATALNADSRCLSRDDKMKQAHLPQLVLHLPAVAELLWVNPTWSGTVAWIQAGLSDEPSQRVLSATRRAPKQRGRRAAGAPGQGDGEG